MLESQIVGTLVLGILLELLGSRLKIPILVAKKSLLFSRWFYLKSRGREIWSKSEVRRFIEVLQLTSKSETRPHSKLNLGCLTLIVVASPKDYDVLEEVIIHAFENVHGFEVETIRIIVPDKQAVILSPFFLNSIGFGRLEIIDERDTLPCDEIKRIFATKFPDREGWCLQQFLKFYAVGSASTKYALIIDADTLILNSRSWINERGELGLTPTLEYQSQYYELLIKLGVIDFFPSISFVPHHMFYDVEVFRDLMKQFQLEEPLDFAAKVNSFSDKTSQSPFCIDYELYAQYLYFRFPEKIRLLRWANLSLRRKEWFTLMKNKKTQKALGLIFNSVSLHSWN